MAKVERFETFGFCIKDNLDKMKKSVSKLEFDVNSAMLSIPKIMGEIEHYSKLLGETNYPQVSNTVQNHIRSAISDSELLDKEKKSLDKQYRTLKKKHMSRLYGQYMSLGLRYTDLNVKVISIISKLTACLENYIEDEESVNE